MLEFLSMPAARVVLALAGVAIVVAIGYYIVRRFRDRIDEDQQTASDWLSNFREMHLGGDISELEYRNIKTVLGAKLQQQLEESTE